MTGSPDPSPAGPSGPPPVDPPAPPPTGPPPGPYGGEMVVAPTRLSARVLLIYPVRVLPSLFLPLVGVLFVGGFSTESFGWAAGGILISLVYSVVRWATFTYGIVGDRLELTRALISRSVRTIPLERVRGVDVSTPPLYRLLGLAVLRVDTGAHGGDDKQEGELDGLVTSDAERLRALLLRTAAARRARVAHGEHDGAPRPAAGRHAAEPEPEPEVVHARVPRTWLVYGPLSGAYLYAPFVLVAGVVGALLQWGEQFGLGGRTLWRVAEWLWERPYLLVVAAGAILLAMPLAALVMYALFHWDFTLRARGDHLVAERGLITRRSVSLERRRVRGYEIVEAPAERWAGVVRMWAIVTGLGDSQTRGQLLPAVPKGEALRVAGAAIGALAAPLRPHPPAARRRRLFRAVAPWALIAAAGVAPPLLTGAGAWWTPSSVAAVLAVLGIPLGLDRYRSLGHTYDGARLSVRSGSLRRSQAVVERRAVVGWTLRQTWFQRRARVMSVIAGVGAGSGGYEAVDVAEDAGPAFAAEVTPEWITPFLRSS